MPTSPPNFHSMVKSKESMAVAQHKQKSASRSNSSKEKVQMHRRSRTGCYTCRLRRKKCDEGSPACTACRNLGLRCEYKRPMWWGNNEQRRQQKEIIKIIIKRKKLAEKNTLTSNKAMTSRDETTPSLLHSLSTSGTFVDSLGRSRSTSIDSHLSLFEFTGVPHHTDLTGYSNQIHSNQYASFLPGLPPFEMDVGAEQDMFVNHLANSCESTVPHYCNFDLNQDWFNEDISSGNLFDLSHDYTLTPAVHTLDLNDRDLRFLDHFIMDVLPSIFPILEIHPERSARLEHVMLALKTNKCYTHCCLSIAAQHCKATMKIQGNQIDSDIIRHRFATVSELCEALNRDTDHNAVLDATLGMILFQGAVGRFEDSLPDIPWHQHFEAAVSLVQKLDLLRHFSESHDHNSIPFNMPLTAWIDILGATMHGRSPTFAHTYRDKYLSSPDASFGLRSLMGCDDRVMFLISEIACLEDLKRSGIDDLKLCQMVHALGDQISLSEIDGPILGTPCNFQGLLRPQQLTSNVTAAFRIAARIYLCSLVPGFTPSQPSCVGLVNKLTQVLEYIPSGPTGFDRSLIWVYLISGSVSTAASPFRTIYIERMRSLGERATLGTLGNLTCILEEIWSQSDMLQDFDTGEVSYISWRDVMCRNDRDFLLI